MMKFEAIYCFDLAAVRFAFYPGGTDHPRMLGEITEQALRGCFHAQGGIESLLRSCELHFAVIEAKARERYATAPGAPVLLDSADFLPSVHTVW